MSEERRSVPDMTRFTGSTTRALGAMPMEQWYVNVLNDVSPDAPMAGTPEGDS